MRLSIAAAVAVLALLCAFASTPAQGHGHGHAHSHGGHHAGHDHSDKRWKYSREVNEAEAEAEAQAEVKHDHGHHDHDHGHHDHDHGHDDHDHHHGHGHAHSHGGGKGGGCPFAAMMEEEEAKAAKAGNSGDNDAKETHFHAEHAEQIKQQQQQQEEEAAHVHTHSHYEGQHDHAHEHSHSGGKEAHHHSDHADGNHGHDHDHDDHGHGHGHSHGHSHSHSHGSDCGHDHALLDEIDRIAAEEKALKAAAGGAASKGADVWTAALLSTLLISAAPVLVLVFIPIDRDQKSHSLLKVLLSFASGGLLGDAFLHLLPHAAAPHGHGHSHSHSHSHGASAGSEIAVGLYTLAGIITFLMVEKLVRQLNGSGGGHSHSHGGPTPAAAPAAAADKDAAKGTDAAAAAVVAHKSHDIDVSGYLNLAADAVHNFTDGLAIGASFLLNDKIAFTTVLAILLHEVPHEIGDFAILVKSGCSKKKALLLQFATAIAALLGTVCGLLSENLGEASAWILPFTAGGFIYIATVSVIPELLQDSGLWQSIMELVAMSVGVVIMLVIAHIEHME